ncbi:MULTISPECIES: hypothetical protein [unclassified Variovorax]|uniref:hypothetical protein n=1 Tax=unclassified Variovorax TaxID=663243 RepID=UPI003F46697E
MKIKKPDNLTAIREKFGVPARRGGAVEVNGQPGIITGMSGDFVRVKLRGREAGVPFHPHEITYSVARSAAGVPLLPARSNTPDTSAWPRRTAASS